MTDRFPYANTSSEISQGTPPIYETPLGAQAKADAAREAAEDVANDALQAHRGMGGNEHPVATETISGFMSGPDKAKINGVEVGSQKNKNAFSIINGIASTVQQDAITLEGQTGIMITTDPDNKKIKITATGESTPGAHASSHLPGGSDPISYATTSQGGLMAPENVTEISNLRSDVNELDTSLDDYKNNSSLVSFNVRDYGIFGDKQPILYSKMALLLEDLYATGGGVIKFPAGDYVFTQDINIQNTRVTVEGVNFQAARLFFTESNGITYQSTNPFSNAIEVKNLSIITTKPALYNGIDVSFSNNMGSAWKNVHISNVTLAGTTTVADYTNQTNNSQLSTQKWARAIKLNNCAVSVIEDSIVRSGDDQTTTSYGFSINGMTTDLMLRNNKVYTTTYGFEKKGTGEGLIIESCMFINVKFGGIINENSTSVNTGVYGVVQNCHINYRQSGIIAYFFPQLSFINNLMYKQDTFTGGSDFSLVNCPNSKFIGNTQIVNAGGGSADGVVIFNSSHCLIKDNIIQERGTAVWVKSGCTDTLVGGNRLQSNNTNLLDQGTTTYYERKQYNITTLSTPSGASGSFTLSVNLPANRFTAVPFCGFCTSSSSTEDIIGFYDFDASSTTVAKFRLSKRDGTSFAGVATRFSVLIIE